MSYRQPFKGEYPITQKYGEIIPGVTVNNRPHTGIDYGCPKGTPILASNDGEVMAAGWDLTGFGFRVILKHPDGRATLYGHLDSIGVNVGDKVKQGQEIGISGDTGKATGPHLHFESRYKWNDYTTHFPPYDLPMMTVDDSISEQFGKTEQLKGAEAFSEGDLLKVQNRLGVKAFFDPAFAYDRVTSYPQGTPFYFTGDTAVNKNNGLTYMRVIPAQFSVWVAVNDGETQLLDK
jgi:murein DD-endopeptidase MepM/ murein hydrolase activator NlpD